MSGGPELVALVELLDTAGSAASVIVALILWRMHLRLDQLVRDVHDTRIDVAELQVIAGVPGGRRRNDPPMEKPQ